MATRTSTNAHPAPGEWPLGARKQSKDRREVTEVPSWIEKMD